MVACWISVSRLPVLLLCQYGAGPCSPVAMGSPEQPTFSSQDATPGVQALVSRRSSVE